MSQNTPPRPRRQESGDEARDRREPPETELHDMGGNIGAASIRGSGVSPGGQRGPQAEPAGGYSEPMGYMAGRDDDWPVTAGSDEKAVSSRLDEVTGNQDTFGPSPQPTPDHVGGRPVEPGHPGFRVRGPVDEAEHGVVDDQDPAPDDPDVRSGVTAGLNSDGGHVTADGDWSESGEEDPDAGSGRTWE
jgi:hypothetical protein